MIASNNKEIKRTIGRFKAAKCKTHQTPFKDFERLSLAASL